MGLPETLLLGFIAGATIVFGLPVGRMRRPAPTMRAMLNALAIGVLLFLVWDVLSRRVGAGRRRAGQGARPHGRPRAGLRLRCAVRRRAGGRARVAGGLRDVDGALGCPRAAGQGRAARRAPLRPGDAVEAEAATWRVSEWSPARRLALMIATGIGLHNFAEGLAIGQSAAAGEIALATLLVIGFGLHNATEGFGIVAPLAGGGDGADATPAELGLPAAAGPDRRRPDVRRHRGRPRLHQRAGERRLLDARGGIDPLRRDPAAQRGRQGPPPGPAGHRPPARPDRGLRHRRDRHRRRRLRAAPSQPSA